MREGDHTLREAVDPPQNLLAQAAERPISAAAYAGGIPRLGLM
jgi:hypothetical protein